MRTGSARLPQLLALCALAAVTLAGCAAGPTPSPVPAPTPIVTADAAAPLFATDEEALAAAEEAYAAYLAVSNQIARDGGDDIERIRPFVSERGFEQESAEIAQFKLNGWRGEGGVEFDSMRLQAWSERDGLATMAVYLCADASNARLRDVGGSDVTPAGRSDRTPLEVVLVSHSAAPEKLLIESSKVWSGDDFC